MTYFSRLSGDTVHKDLLTDCHYNRVTNFPEPMRGNVLAFTVLYLIIKELRLFLLETLEATELKWRKQGWLAVYCCCEGLDPGTHQAHTHSVAVKARDQAVSRQYSDGSGWCHPHYTDAISELTSGLCRSVWPLILSLPCQVELRERRWQVGGHTGHGGDNFSVRLIWS